MSAAKPAAFLLLALLASAAAPAQGADPPYLHEVREEISRLTQAEASDANGWNQVADLLPTMERRCDPAYEAVLLHGSSLFGGDDRCHATTEQMGRVVAEFRPFRERLKRAMDERQASLYPFDWSRGPKAPMLRILTLSELTQCLVLEADFEVRKGDFAKAFESLEIGARLNEGVIKTGSLMQGTCGLSELKRVYRALDQTIEQCPLRHELFRSTLAWLDKRPSPIDLFDGVMGREYFYQRSLTDDAPTLDRLFAYEHSLQLYPRGASQRLLVSEAARKLNGAPKTDLDFYAKGQLEWLLATLWLEKCRTNAALLGYRAEKGVFPEHLEELVPGWLPQAPFDPRDPHQLLGYRREEGDFWVYVNGLDGTADPAEGVPLDLANGATSRVLLLHEPGARLRRA